MKRLGLFCLTLLACLCVMPTSAQISGYIDYSANTALHNIAAHVKAQVQQAKAQDKVKSLKRGFIRNRQADYLRLLFKNYPQAVNDTEDTFVFFEYYAYSADGDFMESYRGYKEPVACLAANTGDKGLLKVYIENNVENQKCHHVLLDVASSLKELEKCRDDAKKGTISHCISMYVDWSGAFEGIPSLKLEPQKGKKPLKWEYEFSESSLLRLISIKDDAEYLLGYILDKNATNLIADMGTYQLRILGKNPHFMTLAQKKPDLLFSDDFDIIWSEMSLENKLAAMDAFPKVFEKLSWKVARKDEAVFRKFVNYHKQHLKPAFMTQAFWERSMHEYNNAPGSFLAAVFPYIAVNKEQNYSPEHIRQRMGKIEQIYEEKVKQISDAGILAQLAQDYNQLIAMYHEQEQQANQISPSEYFDQPAHWEKLKSIPQFVGWFNKMRGDTGFKINNYRVEYDDYVAIFNDHIVPTKKIFHIYYQVEGEHLQQDFSSSTTFY